MQTVVQVICTRGRSLREAIAKDPKLKNYELRIVLEKKLGRRPGWTKVRSCGSGRRGSLNINWNAATAILTCRVINRGTGKPHLIVGDFVDYLLDRHAKRVKFLNILPGPGE